MRTIAGMVLLMSWLSACSVVPYGSHRVSVPANASMISLPSQKAVQSETLLSEMAQSTILMKIPANSRIHLSHLEFFCLTDTVLLLRAFPEYIASGVVHGRIRDEDVDAEPGDVVYWTHDGQFAIQIKYGSRASARDLRTLEISN